MKESITLRCPECKSFSITIGSTKSKKNTSRKCPKCKAVLSVSRSYVEQAPGHEEHYGKDIVATKKNKKPKRKK